MEEAVAITHNGTQSTIGETEKVKTARLVSIIVRGPRKIIIVKFVSKVIHAIPHFYII